jgi:hypothetical protein
MPNRMPQAELSSEYWIAPAARAMIPRTLDTADWLFKCG